MYLHIYVVERKKQMIKRVIDEKIKDYQKLKEYYVKEYFEKNSLDLSNESKITLINIAINDLEIIKLLYLQELKDKGERK